MLWLCGKSPGPSLTSPFKGRGSFVHMVIPPQASGQLTWIKAKTLPRWNVGHDDTQSGVAMKTLLLTTALVLGTASGALAQQKAPQSELSRPIVMFTPVVAKNADALNLTAEQRADVRNWIATMPAKRKAIEAEAIAARAALREAIIAGAPQAERQQLAEAVGALEVRLVMARSACTDHWRAVLSEDQFKQMLDLAQAK